MGDKSVSLSCPRKVQTIDWNENVINYGRIEEMLNIQKNTIFTYYIVIQHDSTYWN